MASRKAFSEAYESLELELEYQVISQRLKARAKAGLTREAVAQRMGTTKSAPSRLESAALQARRSVP